MPKKNLRDKILQMKNNLWQWVVSLIGDCRPSIHNEFEGVSDNRASGIPLRWIISNWSECPQDAEATSME